MIGIGQSAGKPHKKRNPQRLPSEDLGRDQGTVQPASPVAGGHGDMMLEELIPSYHIGVHI